MRAALRALEMRFAASGIAEPHPDAAVLVEAATGLDRAAMAFGGERPLGVAPAAALEAFAARRLAGEPVFRILGRRPFFGLELCVTPDVLDPRPDTEVLVDVLLAASHRRRGEPLRVLDLGTGSGAILAALLSERPAAIGVAVDRSPAACRVAHRNLAGFGARALVLAGDWDAALGAGAFDVVASNPPYIESAAIATLDREVREHDPVLALDGGTDGLDAYRTLAPALPRLLRPGGVAAVEVGWTQGVVVAALMASHGLAGVEVRRDLAGHGRVVLGWLSDAGERAS